MQAQLARRDCDLELIGHLDGLNDIGLLGVLLFPQLRRLRAGGIAGQHLRAPQNISIALEYDLSDQAYDGIGPSYATCEVVLRDLKQSAVFQRSYRCAARLIVYYRHFANDAARFPGTHVEQVAIVLFDNNAYAPLLNEIGASPCVSLGHYDLTGLEEFFRFQSDHTMLHLVWALHDPSCEIYSKFEYKRMILLIIYLYLEIDQILR
jgi:hypothetical protein